MKKILIFTDSRGEHVPKSASHTIFSKMIAETSGYDVDLFLCPFKWTTTLDFIANFPKDKLREYDSVVLYTGIVEWSPRPIDSAINSVLYDVAATPYDKNDLRRDLSNYNNKLVNRKGDNFEYFFGKERVKKHLKLPYETEYDGSKTISLYNLEMAEVVAKYLDSIENLIFINANRIVDGWNGDYFRERPANISITHDYADIFANTISSDKLIDLRVWDDQKIKQFTCDNIHLSTEGNLFLYNALKAAIEKTVEHKIRQAVPLTTNVPHKPKRTSGKITFVFGVMVDSDDDERLDNLKYVVNYVLQFFDTDYEILILEQGKRPRLEALFEHDRIRHEYIYNDQYFNRGWGFNVAAKHFMNESDVLICMDTDVLVSSNITRAVSMCRNGYVAVSPYKNVYYTSVEEKVHVLKQNDFNFKKRESSLKNPVTITGGVVVLNKDKFLAVGGFEEYNGYGCEDRALDVTLINKYGEDRVAMLDEVYLHLHHESDGKARNNFKSIYQHLQKFYNCVYHPELTYKDYIHKNCNHSEPEITNLLAENRTQRIGNLDYYRSTERICNSSIEDVFRDTSLIKIANSESVKNSPAKLLRLNEIGLELYKDSPSLVTALDFVNRFSKNAGISLSSSSKKLNSRNIAIDEDREKTLIVMGNGPSLKHIDFDLLKGYDTFCLNSFYRFFDELDFYPTYFGCFDNLVTSNHRESFQNLLNDSKNGIKKFFFIQEFDDPTERLQRIKFNNAILKEWKGRVGVSKSLEDYWIYENSGASAVHAGIAMGYKKIIILGVDCNYVQVVEGAEQLGDKANELVISKTPKENPNYWRDDYQVQGDVYHVPDAHKYQKPEWERLAANVYLDDWAKDIDIVNCSPTTTLDCFLKLRFQDTCKPDIRPILDETTVLIKSHGRFQLLSQLIASIKDRFKQLKILVVDDSGDEFPSNLITISDSNLKLIKTEYDIGLSEGRNRLLDMCDTKYFVLCDEDFLFCSFTNLEKVLLDLASSSVDIFGGAVFDIGRDAFPHNQPRSFHGSLQIEDGILRIDSDTPSNKKSVDGYPICDLVMNFFVAKTARVSKVKWDSRLKLAEHLDFFIRAKESELVVSYRTDLVIKHQQDFSHIESEYKEKRQTVDVYNDIFKKKHGIREIFKNGIRIKG